MIGQIDETVLTFALEYLVFVTICFLVLTVILFKKVALVWRKRFPEQYEYGVCNGRPARRSVKRGNVQFVLWEAGEQGHAVDCWHNFDSSWWPKFCVSATPDNAAKTTARRCHLKEGFYE